MMNTHVISGDIVEKVIAIVKNHKASLPASENEASMAASALIQAIQDGKVTDALASVAIRDIAGGNTAYCTWVEDELKGCPHDAVTEMAKVAGDRVIDDYETLNENDEA